MRARQGAHAARPEDGFTLVELICALVIIAILMAVAIPVFGGATTRGQDSAARGALRDASKAVSVYEVEMGVFDDSPLALTELGDIETSVVFVDGDTPSTARRMVSVAEDDAGTELSLAVRSDSNSCFYLRLSQREPESRHREDRPACLGSDFVDGADTGW